MKKSTLKSSKKLPKMTQKNVRKWKNKTVSVALFSQPKNQAFPRALFYCFLAQNEHKNDVNSWENHFKNDTWNEVEKTSTKCVKSDAVRPVKKRVFDWKGCRKSLKPEVRTIANIWQKWYQNIIEISEKWALELNKKRCLKTYPKKSKKNQKMTPESIPESDLILGVAPPGAPLVAQTVFGH